MKRIYTPSINPEILSNQIGIFEAFRKDIVMGASTDEDKFAELDAMLDEFILRLQVLSGDVTHVRYIESLLQRMTGCFTLKVQLVNSFEFVIRGSDALIYEKGIKTHSWGKVSVKVLPTLDTLSYKLSEDVETITQAFNEYATLNPIMKAAMEGREF